MEAAACRELGAPELLRFDDMPPLHLRHGVHAPWLRLCRSRLSAFLPRTAGD